MKILKWHCAFIVSKNPIPKEYLRALREGKAHLRHNPVRRTHKPPQEANDIPQGETLAAE